MQKSHYLYINEFGAATGTGTGSIRTEKEVLQTLRSFLQRVQQLYHQSPKDQSFCASEFINFMIQEANHPVVRRNMGVFAETVYRCLCWLDTNDSDPRLTTRMILLSMINNMTSFIYEVGGRADIVKAKAAILRFLLQVQQDFEKFAKQGLQDQHKECLDYAKNCIQILANIGYFFKCQTGGGYIMFGDDVITEEEHQVLEYFILDGSRMDLMSSVLERFSDDEGLGPLVSCVCNLFQYSMVRQKLSQETMISRALQVFNHPGFGKLMMKYFSSSVILMGTTLLYLQKTKVNFVAQNIEALLAEISAIVRVRTEPLTAEIFDNGCDVYYNATCLLFELVSHVALLKDKYPPTVVDAVRKYTLDGKLFAACQKAVDLFPDAPLLQDGQKILFMLQFDRTIRNRLSRAKDANQELEAKLTERLKALRYPVGYQTPTEKKKFTKLGNFCRNFSKNQAELGAAGKKLKQCSRCHDAWYCSAECQLQHWPLHKQTCQQKKNHEEASASLPSQ